MNGMLSRLARGLGKFETGASMANTLPLPSIGAGASHAGLGGMVGGLAGAGLSPDDPGQGFVQGAAMGGAGMLGTRMMAPGIQRIVAGLREALKKQAPQAAAQIDQMPDEQVLQVAQRMSQQGGAGGGMPPGGQY